MPITLLGSTDSRITFGDVSQLGGITTGLTVALDLVITAATADNMRLCGQWGQTADEYCFILTVTDTDELGFAVNGPSQMFGIKTTALNLAPGSYRIACTYNCTNRVSKIFVNGVSVSTTGWLGGTPTVLTNASVPVYVGNDSVGYDGVDGSYANFALWGQVLADAVCVGITDGTTDRSTLQSSTGILYAPLTAIGSTSDLWNGYIGVAFLGATLRFVNTGSTAGGTGLSNATTGTDRAYATLAAAAASLNGANIVSTGWPWRIICSGSVADTTAVTLSGDCATSVACYLEIDAADSDWAMGFWDTTKYRLDVTDANGITVLTDHVIIRGLQVKLTSSAVSNAACIRTGDSFFPTRPNPFTDIYGCMFLGDISGGFGGGAGAAAIDGYVRRKVRFINCTAHNFYNINYPTTTVWGFRIVYAPPGSGIFNCTSYSSNRGVEVADGYPVIVTNCLSFCKGVNSNFFDFVGVPGSGSNNLSSDATAPGTASLLNQTAADLDFLSTTLTHPNFLDLDTTSAALSAGLADPLAGVYLDDSRRRTRTVPWGIGSAEPLPVVAPGAGLDTERERAYADGMYVRYVPAVGEALDLSAADTLTVTEALAGTLVSTVLAASLADTLTVTDVPTPYLPPPVGGEVLVPVLIPSYRRRRMV